MKPLTLKPDEIKSLQSGRVVIWREIKDKLLSGLDVTDIVKDSVHHGYHICANTRDGRRDSKFLIPLYMPGAEFWVRETWRPIWIYDDSIGVKFRGVRYSGHCNGTKLCTGAEKEQWKRFRDNYKFKLPQHMPRWASRYNVRVVSVEPEHRDTWGWRVELEVV